MNFVSDETMRLPPQVTHFAWCSLVAVALARLDGRIGADTAEQAFLLRWLQQAQREKRFSRDVAPVILALIRLGQVKTSSTRLKHCLQYYWELGAGLLSQHSDMYRLHCALTLLQLDGWQNAFAASQKKGEGRTASFPKGKGVLVDAKAMRSVFDEQGHQREPLVLEIEGTTAAVQAILGHCGFHCSLSNAIPQQLIIAPDA
ncbi:DUF2913 family protein [Rahnella sp. CG8]|uniref:DUF2913 family protein n=1 Tax=Rahnella sp. CG8 TaxID=2726078 RepID=UPI0020345B00|nr:DUF2913 family protein [Rahnella sp. CG8]MCM2448245.1 DUF2913 family protein [Rahnella sp. CG8]